MGVLPPKMFFHIARMAALGFAPAGSVHTQSKTSCHHYRKLYPEQHAVLCFSEIRPIHGMMLFLLTPAQYAQYLSGEKALPFFDKNHGRTPDGYGYLPVQGEVIYTGQPWLTRTKQLVELITIAEALPPQPVTR